MATPSPELSILICTARRTRWLAELLRELATDEAGRPGVEVVVVDNDPEGTARGTVEEAAGHAGCEVRYEHWPRPGIAGARNRCVALARAERVLFLDDDQAIDPGFFAALERAWRRRPHGSIGVRPRVLPRHEPGADPRFAAVPRSARGPMATCSRLEFATNGVMLERQALLALGSAPFDPRFDLSGGEDTDLFVRLEQRGARVAWCPEVIVWERVPPARATRRYLLRHELRIGLTEATIAKRTLGASTVEVLAEAAAKLGWLAVKTALRVGQNEAPYHALARVVGQVYGALGGRFEAYRPKGRGGITGRAGRG